MNVESGAGGEMEEEGGEMASKTENCREGPQRRRLASEGREGQIQGEKTAASTTFCWSSIHTGPEDRLLGWASSLKGLVKATLAL